MNNINDKQAVDVLLDGLNIIKNKAKAKEQGFLYISYEQEQENMYRHSILTHANPDILAEIIKDLYFKDPNFKTVLNNAQAKITAEIITNVSR